MSPARAARASRGGAYRAAVLARWRMTSVLRVRSRKWVPGISTYTAGIAKRGWVMFTTRTSSPRRDRAARHRPISSLRLGRERLGRLSRGCMGPGAMR